MQGHSLRRNYGRVCAGHLLSSFRLWGVVLIATMALVFVIAAGPVSAGIDVWTSIGPEGGDVNTLVVDAETPSTLYAGTNDGVYKSTDSGASWDKTNTGLTNTYVHTLATDPVTPTILYAGTDDGVFKSTNGAASWSESNTGLTAFHVLALAIDPATPDTVYAGTLFDGVFKSEDGGESWNPVNTGLTDLDVNTLVIDPATPSTLYAGTRDGGVFKSEDGGESWNPVNTGLTDLDVNTLAIDPVTPTTLYAGTDTGVFMSEDGGENWNGPVLTVGTYALAINSATPSTLYAGTWDGVHKTINSGGSWSPASTGLTVSDVISLAIDPATPSTLYAGTYGGGVFKSIDSGTSWRIANTGLIESNVPALVIDPATPTTLYAGTGGGVFKSINSGATWSVVNNVVGTGLIEPNVRTLAIDPVTPTILYAGTSRGMYKSIDSGASWSDKGPESLGFRLNATSLVIDPVTPTTIYAGGRRDFISLVRGVYKSMDSGARWISKNSGLTDTQVNALAIDPLTPATLYAGTDTGVFKSMNGGDSWEPINTGLSDSTRVNTLGVDPTTPTTLYAGTNDGLFKSINGGANWSQVFAGAIYALAIDPATSTTLYVGRFDGVFRSKDGGASWGDFSSGLTTTNVRALAIDPVTPTKLYAGTSGGGAFAIQIDNQNLTYAKVVNQNGQPIAGAHVYRNGQIVTDFSGTPLVTDAAGTLILTEVLTDDTLVALALLHEQPTVRQGHSDWAYQVYKTSLTIDAEGNPQPFKVITPTGPQNLTVRPDNSLTLFNLVVSIEWDATEAYLQDVYTATKSAADFLYDVTDGQMTFGYVAIYDNAEHWAEADIQISAKNVVHPHAYIRGITDNDKSHVIRVGRSWDGNSGNQGDWSQPNGFKTLVHEFGHYGLGLYDEYFGYNMVGGELAGQREAFCTERRNWNELDSLPDGASIMDYHYKTSELADQGRWTSSCQGTAQHQLNNGEADWQTLLRLYSDPTGQSRWRLVTPDERAGPGQAIRGPEATPTSLPFPIVTVSNSGDDPDPVSLTVCYNGTPYHQGAWVTLYFGGKAMDQGLTNSDAGLLSLLGARPGDTLHVISLDGILAGSATVTAEVALELRPTARATRSNESGPYLRLWPTTSGGNLDGLRLVVTGTLPTDNLTYALTGADSIGPSNTIPYAPSSGDHRVQVSFIPAAHAGHAKVLGSHDGQFFDLNVDYRLQHALNISETTLFANDGNLKLYLEAGSLEQDEVYFLIASPWGLPGSLPPGRDIVGEAYEITAANNITSLVKPAVLRFSYDAAAGSAFENLRIYRWDFGTVTWQELGSEVDTEKQEVVTTITELGLYALMGTPVDTFLHSSQRDSTDLCNPSVDLYLYLPMIIKD